MFASCCPKSPVLHDFLTPFTSRAGGFGHLSFMKFAQKNQKFARTYHIVYGDSYYSNVYNTLLKNTLLPKFF
jgi:hypothetical protein